MADFVGPVESCNGIKGVFIDRDKIDCFLYGAEDGVTCVWYSGETDEARFKGDITPLLLGQGGKTNADRIRAMTDEEMARFFERRYDTCPGRPGCSGKNCYDCWLDWLRQEVSDNG